MRHEIELECDHCDRAAIMKGKIYSFSICPFCADRGLGEILFNGDTLNTQDIS